MKTQSGSPLSHVARLALFSLALAPGLLFAQDGAPPPPSGSTQDGGPPPRGEHRDPAERQARMLQMMTRRLNLSPDQVGQIKTIQSDSQTQMQALRTDGTAGPERREKAMAIHKAENEKVRAVLNDEQRTKFDAMEAKQQEHRRGGSPDGGAPPPPPQQ